MSTEFSWQNLPQSFTALAPMEDVTDTVFRRLIAECGSPSVFFSEFTSTDGMFSRGAERVIHRLQFTKEEKPLIAQIWGKNPEMYFRAAKELGELGFDGIDINMGCPVEKIIKTGNCSALIENPTLAKELFVATREGAGKLPVSIKTRIGFSDVQTEPWTAFLLELKPDALTVHGRIAKHGSKYPANWNEIQKVVSLRNQADCKTVVIGNGDVRSYSEALEKSERYGVDGIMIGRGVFENLFIFREGALSLKGRDPAEKLSLLLKHVEMYTRTWQGKKPYRVLKKYFKIYAANFPGAAELRMRLVQTESEAEVVSVVKEWLYQYERRHLKSDVGPTPSNEDRYEAHDL